MEKPENIIQPDHKWAFLQHNIHTWWQEHDHSFPWRTPTDEWRQIVTEILLQRTRAEAVAQMYEAFFIRFQSPDDLGNAAINEVEEAIYSLGLAWRAKHLQTLGEVLTLTNGSLPESTEELKELPGVGPYAAGAMQVLHRNRPETFVDVNVVRLIGRYFGFEWDGETRRKKWFLKLVDRLFEHSYQPRDFGYALLDFTREVCAPRPLCKACPIAKECQYFQTFCALNNQ